MASAAIDPASIRAYVTRDWQGARDAKRRYWRDRLDRGGLREALRVTHELRTWMQQVEASWPTERDREEDLETHRRVAQALRKTGRTSRQAPAPSRGRARRVR